MVTTLKLLQSPTFAWFNTFMTFLNLLPDGAWHLPRFVKPDSLLILLMGMPHLND